MAEREKTSEAGHTIAWDNRALVLRVTLRGFWTVTSAHDFRNELMRAIAAIRRRPWPMLLDADRFLTQAPDVSGLVIDTLTGATAAGMGTVAVVTTNALAKMQLARMLREAGATQQRIVSTEVEGLEWLAARRPST